MNKTRALSYIFRKFPVLRWILGIFVIAIVILISIILSFKAKPQPKIISLTPQVGSPGDLVVIKGENFGQKKDTNYVEFGNNKLTASSILSWKDDEIKLIIPANIQDGLVYIGNKDVKSNPKFFANSTLVPVPREENPENQLPYIDDFNNIHSYRPAVGKILTLYGKNFGHTREKSKIYFTCNRENVPNSNETNDEFNKDFFIPASEEDFDYKYWSDSEIQVKIPDGATSGNIFIESAKGNSEPVLIDFNLKSGTKKFVSPKTFVVKISVDIEDYSNDKNSSIILRCPRPLQTPQQPKINMLEYNPEPVISDFQHTVINQTSFEKSVAKKQFYQTYTITNYECATQINENQVQDYSSETLTSYEKYLEPDSITPSDEEKIIALAKKIVLKEKNPYRKAKLIFNYMISNFTILNDQRNGKISVLDLLNTKTGDAYDFATIFTSLLRATKIPAITASGILVSPNLKTQNHWWTEFFVENVGWIPCDVSIAAGLNYQTWIKEIDVKSFYFGNLDAQHIIFSRGLNEIKAGFSNNKTVYRPRTYALQSIWEETSGEKIKYSSYWADPVIIGVY